MGDNKWMAGAAGWISTNDILPDEKTPVWVCNKSKPKSLTTALVVWEDGGWLWYVQTYGDILDADSYECDDDYEFSHWQPFPEVLT